MSNIRDARRSTTLENILTLLDNVKLETNDELQYKGLCHAERALRLVSAKIKESLPQKKQQGSAHIYYL